MATNSAIPPSPDRNVVDGDLSRSLNHLTISTSSPAKPLRSPRSPRPPAIDLPTSSSQTPRRPSSSLRSPLHGPSSTARSPSRSGTPTLLKKASLNSLHSANVTPLRRASSASILSPTHPNSSRSAKSPLRAMSPEPPLPTAYSIAKDHFKKELEVHEKVPETIPKDALPNTVVILQDDCYGHRYSRPRTSKRDLANVVERPERLRACVLGVSAAYVRLGGQHENGTFPIDQQTNRVASQIPFIIKKSDRRLPHTSEAVTNVHGQEWMEELVMMCQAAEEKLATNGKELQRPGMDRGLNAEPPRKFHEGDLYLCPESLHAMEGAMGGVCDAVDTVFEAQGPKRAFVAIRPPGHHCSADYPSGFCWVNNVHVGIMHGAMSYGLTHAAIIDIDLHHGDGSQEITWKHNARRLETAKSKNAPHWKKASIGYFSLHDINSYPCEFGDQEKVRNASLCIDNAHGQSIWNIHLESWETEAEFWKLYDTKYSLLLEKTRKYLQEHTAYLRSKNLGSKGAIFISAGFDASEHEDEGMRRHKVNVPTEFYARITRDIARIAEEESTGVEGRIISVLEGGYSDRTLCSGVLSHICGLTTSDENSTALSKFGPVSPYSSSWWSRDELLALETAVGTVAAEMKRPRVVTPPTYSSPTQASAARSVVPLKPIRRTVSGLPEYRVPTPPPPEVPWTIATVELSRLLIPETRTTTSCTSEELKVRKDRQQALGQERPTSSASVAPPVVDRAPTRMSLRERKPRPSAVAAAVTAPERKPRQQRRLSAASTIVSEAREPSPPPPVPRPTPVKPTMRPESVMSHKPTNGTIVVKKTRTKKPEQQPKVSTVANDAIPKPVGVVTPEEAPAVQKPNSPRMDALSNQVKKIRITIVNKSGKEKPVADESVPVFSPTDSEQTKQSASSPVESFTSPLLSPGDMTWSDAGGNMPAVGALVAGTEPTVYGSNGAVSEVGVTVSGAEPTGIQLELASSATPVKSPTPMQRKDLPVFGSTGVIPFSSAPANQF
ncbi:histone deacetylase domain-containing protein [Podospora fimiseda]|uniref:Histone deacetylase domain-containing protein n=1 Tax=Podospora fimiseda TaxID=252190 RepID=A0AAN7BTM5_9PEZI|nr:histone deacetylase domain-containing protein [Podospora fimiseda]